MTKKTAERFCGVMLPFAALTEAMFSHRRRWIWLHPSRKFMSEQDHAHPRRGIGSNLTVFRA